MTTIKNNIKYKQVANLLDGKIIRLLGETGLVAILEELGNMDTKFRGVIARDFKDVDVDHLLETDDVTTIETINGSKLKYYISYIHHCAKRKLDIKWMIRHRSRFPKLKNLQVFNLLILKEKLSIENAVEIKEMTTENTPFMLSNNSSSISITPGINIVPEKDTFDASKYVNQNTCKKGEILNWRDMIHTPTQLLGKQQELPTNTIPYTLASAMFKEKKEREMNL